MSRDITDRLNTFGVDALDFQRIALNMDQIEQYNPPPNPTKVTDSRAQGYIEEFGYECWELDALEPRVLSELIDTHVRPYRNYDTYNRVIVREQRERELLEELSNNWQGIENNWEDIKERYFND